MSDHAKSTSSSSPIPPDSQEDTALRFTFSHWLEDDTADALEKLATRIIELTREADVVIAKIPAGRVQDEALAGADDLGFLADWFRRLGETSRGDSPAERLVIQRAEEWAERIDAIAAEVEGLFAEDEKGVE